MAGSFFVSAALLKETEVTQSTSWAWMPPKDTSAAIHRGDKRLREYFRKISEAREQELLNDKEVEWLKLKHSNDFDQR